MLDKLENTIAEDFNVFNRIALTVRFVTIRPIYYTLAVHLFTF